ncbi:MAG: TVP38/TMEM64 family protein [Adlercreutzia sp.]|nr:TVP38/TMEM64 family protein [Adlercreutzia sp.]
MSRTDHTHHSERLQKLEAKAHEEKTVAGHPMPAADIFKFAGLIVFFIIMIIVCVALWPMIHELAEPGGIERVTTEVRNAGPWGFLILLAIQFLQIVVAFIPGEVVQVAAGMIYGPWVGALIIWIGCIISSSFIFVLVHKLGAPFVQAMVPEKYMGKFREWEKSPKFNAIVFILFLIPGLPKDVFTYLTPLTHMSMRSFVLISNFARIPGIVLSTYAASGLVTGDIAQSVAIFAVTALIAIVALVVYSRITKKK